MLIFAPHCESEVSKLADFYDDDGPVHCENCGCETSEFDGHMCQYCQAMICAGCWIMGDDVTGDQCPVCGTYENLRGC